MVKLADQAVVRAVLGDEADAGVEDLARGRAPAMLCAVERDRARASAAAARGAPR